MAAGLSAARLIVALTRRTAAATAMTRGSVRIRPDTAGASEAWNALITPLMGEVDDVGGEGVAARGGERHRSARLGHRTELSADDPLRAVVLRGVPAVAQAVDADVGARVRGVDDVPTADVDPDVVQPVEEHEVSGLKLVSRNGHGVRVVPLRDG